uniref:(northern house mosquito) hypothetical protein n=1 Tax=Culex pipiens TaxID=7175 RepID=A0A8D8G927_CULPI
MAGEREGGSAKNAVFDRTPVFFSMSTLEAVRDANNNVKQGEKRDAVVERAVFLFHNNMKKQASMVTLTTLNSFREILQNVALRKAIQMTIRTKHVAHQAWKHPGHYTESTWNLRKARR